jgi:hypothetical protein
MQIANTNETYYIKFSDEFSRMKCIDRWTSHQYYIEHYTYERDNDGKSDYMLGITLGNYFGKNSKVLGHHIPLPIHGNFPEGGTADE